MRILHTADVHLGLVRHSAPGTTSRLDDFAATLMRFADTAVERKVDVAIIAGDTFHSRRPTPRDLVALMAGLNVLRDAKITTLISSGNHDGPDAVGDSRTNALAWMPKLNIAGVHAFTEPFAHYLHYGSKAFGVVAIPYPHRRSFDALLPDATPEERIEEISRRLESAIEVMYDKVNDMGNGTEPIIFVGHLSTLGSKLGTEVTMRFGWDVAVRAAILDRFDYAALGHIHRQQEVGRTAWYAGSPEFMDFGEEGQPKGFILAEVERGELPKVEIIDSKPRPMLTLDLRRSKTDPEAWVTSGAGSPDGAIVRLRIHGDSEVPVLATEVSKLVKQFRGQGAKHVQSEVILPEREHVVRMAVDAHVAAAEALRMWLVANHHEIEPALGAGMEIIQSIGAKE